MGSDVSRNSHSSLRCLSLFLMCSMNKNVLAMQNKSIDELSAQRPSSRPVPQMCDSLQQEMETVCTLPTGGSAAGQRGHRPYVVFFTATFCIFKPFIYEGVKHM